MNDNLEHAEVLLGYFIQCKNCLSNQTFTVDDLELESKDEKGIKYRFKNKKCKCCGKEFEDRRILIKDSLGYSDKYLNQACEIIVRYLVLNKLECLENLIGKNLTKALLALIK